MVEASMDFALAVTRNEIDLYVIVVLDIVLDYPRDCPAEGYNYGKRMMVLMASGWGETPMKPSTWPVELKNGCTLVSCIGESRQGLHDQFLTLLGLQ